MLFVVADYTLTTKVLLLTLVTRDLCDFRKLTTQPMPHQKRSRAFKAAAKAQKSAEAVAAAAAAAPLVEPKTTKPAAVVLQQPTQTAVDVKDAKNGSTTAAEAAASAAVAVSAPEPGTKETGRTHNGYAVHEYGAGDSKRSGHVRKPKRPWMQVFEERLTSSDVVNAHYDEQTYRSVSDLVRRFIKTARIVENIGMALHSRLCLYIKPTGELYIDYEEYNEKLDHYLADLDKLRTTSKHCDTKAKYQKTQSRGASLTEKEYTRLQTQAEFRRVKDFSATLESNKNTNFVDRLAKTLMKEFDKSSTSLYQLRQQLVDIMIDLKDLKDNQPETDQDANCDEGEQADQADHDAKVDDDGKTSKANGSGVPFVPRVPRRYANVHEFMTYLFSLPSGIYTDLIKKDQDRLDLVCGELKQRRHPCDKDCHLYVTWAMQTEYNKIRRTTYASNRKNQANEAEAARLALAASAKKQQA